ncbi:MAG: laminin G [Saprospirales bacterium]|nr:laminin G [Saprospirales bacterium]
MKIFRYSVFTAFFLGVAPLLFGQPGQIAVPRVEMMPNQPAPYNVRDWKQVAQNYDAFLYDITKTGQFLPLCFLMPSGVNYPQNESFRLHTYVGTNSPLGNEAVNVLPSMVGATLVGVDKSDQFGKDWLLMSQDFYNKANGENLYLNNAGASSGGDWWYDMMPNVYFYQLYDLYPDMGGEGEQQFSTIANLFLEAVRAMGGKEAPWEPAYMNYRAWKFKTMEPNDSGVPEPEAAGTFAWVLYNAWKETGNPEYLKGAEWSIEFLNNWSSNPSYELQLPYGTLTAAKMNAELGTDYDVEKMVNWSFDKGELRGWGTIVGNWGGFDVSGLIGEANDGGNDYAFQMNGMQQAGALVPMVRYDKRFARAIGKWVLNLANASRLYFPGFLPASLQDASAWSSANDPDQVIGYEALREVWQGNSPYSTGDALQGGWAATNLALYGTSSIGYLGAIVEKTNVSKILKLDLLKTDFYRNDAYSTYLFYNSYNIAKAIQFDAGPDLVDVYEALSETFILENISGVVDLTIPANEAFLITVTPAGGAISYDKNQMLVDGVVVDYNQSAQAYTWPPRIKGLAAETDPIEVGDSTTIYASVSDADSGQFTFQWTTTAGSIIGTTGEVWFKATAVPGDAEIQCIVTDLDGNSDTATLILSIVPEINDPPQILEIQKDPPYAAPGASVQLTCLASDPENSALLYEWTSAQGSFTGAGSLVQWTAPLSEGVVQLSVKVTDDQGLSTSATTNMLVKVFNATAGNLIAYYPFTGNANDVSGNDLHGQVNGALLTADQFGKPQNAYYFNGGLSILP